MKNALLFNISILVFVFSFTNLKSQDTLLMMNGKELLVESVQDTGFVEISFRYNKNHMKNQQILSYNLDLRNRLLTKLDEDPDFSKEDYEQKLKSKTKELKPPKLRSGSADRDEIFSFTSKGKETVYYQQDEVLGNYYSVEEMRTFIFGERDARINHRGRGAFWGGIATGVGAGYLLETSTVGLAVPVAFALAMRIPVIKVRDRDIIDPTYKYNETYLAGFATTARNRNMMQGLKGSAIGVVAGMVLFAILNPEEVEYFK